MRKYFAPRTSLGRLLFHTSHSSPPGRPPDPDSVWSSIRSVHWAAKPDSTQCGDVLPPVALSGVALVRAWGGPSCSGDTMGIAAPGGALPWGKDLPDTGNATTQEASENPAQDPKLSILPRLMNALDTAAACASVFTRFPSPWGCWGTSAWNAVDAGGARGFDRRTPRPIPTPQ